MKMNKKLIVLVVLFIVAVAVLVSITLEQRKEKIRALWNLDEYHNTVQVTVCNYGYTTVNITGAELIYLPDETLGLIWIEQRIAKSPKGTDREYWCAFSYNAEPQLEFFNLLWQGRNEPIVKIVVETEKAIYTFLPQKYGEQVKPTSIEKK